MRESISISTKIIHRAEKITRCSIEEKIQGMLSVEYGWIHFFSEGEKKKFLYDFCTNNQMYHFFFLKKNVDYFLLP